MTRHLSRMEHAFLVTETFAPLTVVAVLRLTNGPMPAVLDNALACLQQRQPLLRAAIAYHRGRPSLALAAAPLPIPVCHVEWRDEQQWQAVAKMELNGRVDASTAPLMRCTYLYSGADNAPSDLIVTYHHTIMDAASGIQLFQQLLALCAAAHDGTAAADTRSLPLMPAAEAFFPEAFQGRRRLWRLPPFLWRQMRDEFAYRRAMRRAPEMPVRPTSSCDILTLDMAAAATARLVRRARRERVTLYSALAAAMLLAVHAQVYAGRDLPLRGITFANLRPYLTPPIPEVQLGCYISMLPYTVSLRRAMPLWELARAIQAATYQAGKRGDKFLAALVSKPLMQILMRLHRFRMGTTALSYVGPVPLKPTYGTIRVRGVHGFTSNNSLGPIYAAFVKLYQGQLVWDLQYLAGDMDRQMAQAIADHIRAVLEESVMSSKR